MLADDLRHLRANERWPCVSVLSPSRPTDLADLLVSARARLRDELSARHADDLIARLDELGATVAPTRPAVGLFVATDVAHVVGFPQPVRPRVVVDDTFATRDLVATLVRHPRYVVLELDGDGARLWAGLGDHVEPAHTDAFPVAAPAAAPPNERRLRQDRTRLRDTQLQRAVRAVDDALDAALPAGDRRPLFVLGDRSRAPRHLALSRYRDRTTEVVIGRARGVAGRVHDLVADAIARTVDTERAAAVEEVAAAIGSRRLASGIAEVWALARDGRGDLLVVDEQYHTSAVVDPDTGQLTPTEAPRPGGVDDAVDDAIEFVIDRGGRVVVTSDDPTIASWGRIAMKLRH